VRLLFIGINYSPEVAGISPHTAAICEHLAARGHRVTVVTAFPFAPEWKRWREYRGRFMSREELNGVEVVRLSHFIPRRPSSVVQRVLMEGTFCLTAILALIPRYFYRWDAVVYVGAQPSIAMLVRLFSTLRRVPYVVNIMDFASQAAADVGMMRWAWLSRIFTAFEFASYRTASGAIVLCDGFKGTLVRRGYPVDRICIAPPSVDLAVIRPVGNHHEFRRRHQIEPGETILLYSGSMGLKQGLSNVVEAARLLQSTVPTLKWILVGDGAGKRALQELIKKYDLENTVLLLPFQSQDQMASTFSAADALLLNQLAAMKDSVIPSKLLTYMAAGRAILAAVNNGSQAAHLLREAGGAFIVTPEDPQCLASAAAEVTRSGAALAAMGVRNRKYAEEHFDRPKLLRLQEDFLQRSLQPLNRYRDH